MQGKNVFVQTTNVTSYTGVHLIVDYERHSSYRRLLCIIAYIYRFVRYCRSTAVNRNIFHPSVTELNVAEKSLIRSVQSHRYADAMQEPKCNTIRQSITKQLRLYVDEDDSFDVVGGFTTRGYLQIHDFHIFYLVRVILQH